MDELTCKKQIPEINGNIWCQIGIEEKSECASCCKFCINKCDKECIFSKLNDTNLD